MSDNNHDDDDDIRWNDDEKFNFDNILNGVKFSIDVMTSLPIFSKFFDDEILNLVMNATNDYN